MERTYRILRGFFFWLFVFSFAIGSPIIIFYSLGYKFDSQTKYFQKTGMISIKSMPQGAEVYLQNKNLKKFTPCILRELLPGEYKLRIEKEGFYPYEINVKVEPSLVSELNIILIPKIEEVEKLSIEDNFYKFFVTEHIFSRRMIAFAKEAIYILNEDLEEVAKIAPLNLTEEEIQSIKGIKESRGNLVFWTPNNIWIMDNGFWSKKDIKIEHIYASKEPIKEIFFGLKDRYLIIHQGLKVLALDLKNKILFPVYELNDKEAEIYCDSYSDLLFIKDKLPTVEKFSLFKINIAKKIYERTKD
ncbi:MAG: PEGA domain-containing protein [Candidatus Omnitrophica bacterium]|nr:PEGA domain-containing protein [Candidatus Omnitrophota bacterium]